jgi:hypothetical protein
MLSTEGGTGKKVELSKQKMKGKGELKEQTWRPCCCMAVIKLKRNKKQFSNGIYQYKSVLR